MKSKRYIPMQFMPAGSKNSSRLSIDQKGHTGQIESQFTMLDKNKFVFCSMGKH